MNDIFINSALQQKSLYGISIDTIFTTFTTIIIFIIGYIINKIIENHNENRRLKELKDFFIVSVNALKNPINEHIILIDNLAKQIDERNLNSIHFKGVKGFYFSYISGLNQQDLYKAFIQKNRKLKTKRFNHFKSMIDNIENLKTVPGDLKDSFNKYFECANKYLEVWNNNINFIGHKYDNYYHLIKSKNINPNDDQFFLEMDRLNYNSSQIDDYINPFVAIDNYILPLKKIVQKYSNDPRSMELLPAIMKCESSFTEIENLKKYYSKLYNDISINLKDINNSLNEAVQFFDNH